MKIHHLRNASFVIETNQHKILIDPMLGKKSSLPPLAFIRHKPKRNPLVDLPPNSNEILDNVTHCLITHCQKKHLDHLDNQGIKFLQENNIDVLCSPQDQAFLEKKNLNVSQTVKAWKKQTFLNGIVTSVPALHGRGWITKLMANGVGFYIELKNEPSIYISGDTVLTDDVKKALEEYKPDITVVACGNASVDVGRPILMGLDEIIEFAQLSPNKVIANHLEALNHCPLKRDELKKLLQNKSLNDKVWVPNDGESKEYNIPTKENT